MDSLERKLCDMQGRLFKLSVDRKFESCGFMQAFMTSDVAKGLDSEYDRTQWAGEEYLIAEISDDLKDKLAYGEPLDREMMYWIGYLYRYWHYYTKESSRVIVKQAPPKTMVTNYLTLHTMDPKKSIDELKEMYLKRAH